MLKDASIAFRGVVIKVYDSSESRMAFVKLFNEVNGCVAATYWLNKGDPFEKGMVVTGVGRLGGIYSLYADNLDVEAKKATFWQKMRLALF